MYTMRTLQAGKAFNDRRGAVIVMAVFMSIFLVGCLWYLIGIGDAAIYRQRLDAGTDAAAFASAVYHARGMNMIAMLNLIIAASLALIVVAKMLDFVIGIVYNAALWMCASNNPDLPPNACDIAEQTGSKIGKLAKIIDEVEKNGDELLAALSKAQRDVARLTPWVAATESTTISSHYSPVMESSMTVSPAMVPKGERLGLPVRDEPYERTCERGNAIGPLLLNAMIPPIYQPILELAGESIDSLATKFPKEYCGGAHYNGDSVNIFNHHDVCEQEHQNWTGSGGGSGSGSSGAGGAPPPPPPPPDDDDDDEHDWRDDDNDEGGAGEECLEEHQLDDDDYHRARRDHHIDHHQPEDHLDQVPEPELKTAKEMLPPAENGNGYFQVYAFGEGDTNLLRSPDKGVLIAVGNQSLTLLANAAEKHALAQAEFYYDQTSAALGDRCWRQGGSCGLSWPEYRDNALWNLRWRARLRYWREVPPEIDVDILGSDFPTSDDAPVLDDGEIAAEYDLAGTLSVYTPLLSQEIINNITSLRGDLVQRLNLP